jgi:endonuclease/exonuclease/phosphatase family protein
MMRSTMPRRLGPSRALALVAAFAVAIAFSSDPAAIARPSAIAAAVRLTLMEFNIEYGGDVVDFDSVIRAIGKSGADVVGIEEAWANTARIAQEVGWAYYDRRTQIISRLPLIDPPGADGRYIFVEAAPGRVIAIGNVHLPSYPYSPQRILLGASSREALRFERRYRVPAVEPALEALEELAETGIPSFLLGDFNAPSHLDWTSETVGSRPQIRFPLAWPVSVRMQRAGFRDSYREAHPDPLRDPGITWPSRGPRPQGSYDPGPNAPQDRIDFVYAAGPATTLGSTVVGERGAPDVGVSVDPWPTDHRGVLSTFRVRPAVPPTLVAVGTRLVTTGDELQVTFHAPGDPGERVVIVPAGGDPPSAIAGMPTGSGAPTDGRLVFATDGFVAGAYEAVLVGASGAALARVPFWARDPGAAPEVETSEPSYGIGDPIAVAWHGAPGNRFDWIGIYKRGADPNTASYKGWLYTGGTIDGSAVFDRSARGAWPLPAGKYTLYLLEDDAYNAIAHAGFEVG